MPNVSAPKNNNFAGWFRDDLNSRIELYYGTLKVGHLDSSGFSITDDSTARMTDGVLQGSGLASGAVGPASAHPDIKTHQHMVGTVDSVASDGGNALISEEVFIAPQDCKIVSAWAMNISKNDVTKGTATSQTSYRRMNLIANTAAAGTGTHVVASLNATASAASWATRAFAVVASTIPAGGVVRISHLTVGAATAAGTDMAERVVTIAYELV